MDPIAWRAPENPGYVDAFSPNRQLAALSFIELGDNVGPEDAALGPDGLIYTGTEHGDILAIDLSGEIQVFANTGGRPLGLEFDKDGTLYVADALRGLLSVASDGVIRVLATETRDGQPILYADDVDVADDGTVYFTDASMRFGPTANGGALTASVLDLVEHRATGRVLRYDPSTAEVTTVINGLSFANGLALTADEGAVVVVETGHYRVWRVPLDGRAPTVLIDRLPGFPDNLNAVGDGTFWLGLISPRNRLMDALAGKPRLRKMMMALPTRLHPAPTRYGLIARIDAQGNVIETRHDPEGVYAMTTGAITLPDGRVVVTSLIEHRLGVM